MAVFKREVKIQNPTFPEQKVLIEMVVDTGATYTQIPSSILESIGVTPKFKRRLKLADGRIIERDGTIIDISLNGETMPTPVIFGENGSEPLLGAVTLESFSLAVDPVNKTLIPVPELMLFNI